MWEPFGTNANTGLDVITSEETGEDGLPLWEQVVLFYDRQGKPITVEKANGLLGDIDYKRLAVTKIGPYVVSTVWLGVDHGYTRPGPPVIFETMVFAAWEWDRLNDVDAVVESGDDERRGLADIDCHRYCTEGEARTGHEEVCTLIRATYQPIDEHEEEQPHES